MEVIPYIQTLRYTVTSKLLFPRRPIFLRKFIGVVTIFRDFGEREGSVPNVYRKGSATFSVSRCKQATLLIVVEGMEKKDSPDLKYVQVVNGYGCRRLRVRTRNKSRGVPVSLFTSRLKYSGRGGTSLIWVNRSVSLRWYLSTGNV